MLHKLLAIVAFWMLITHAINGNAFLGLGGTGKIVYDPANFVQNAATALHMAESLINQAVQIENQIKQYEEMILQGEQITNGRWGYISGLLDRLSYVVREGDSLAYSMSELDQLFRERYRGYEPVQDWGSEYEQWTQQGLDTFRGVLNGLGLQHHQMQWEQGRIVGIQSLSDGAVGRMQALQAANMFASEQVQSLAKLRQLIMMQTNAQTVYYAHQVNTEAAQEAKIQEWLQAPRPEVQEYESAGFGTMPKIGQ